MRIVVYRLHNIRSIEVDDCTYADLIHELCGANKNSFKHKGYVVWDAGTRRLPTPVGCLRPNGYECFIWTYQVIR